MFCYQCEQAIGAKACNKKIGVCGKTDSVADLQDLLIYIVKGISIYAARLAKLDVYDEEIDVFVMQVLFTTITNVEFQEAKFLEYIKKAFLIKRRASDLYEKICQKRNIKIEKLSGPAILEDTADKEKLFKIAKEVAIEKDIQKFGEDKAGLMNLILYGLKGSSAYLDHAYLLGQKDQKLFVEFHKILDFLTKKEFDIDDLLQKALKVGEINFKVMELLDSAHTKTFGHPKPTKVLTSAKKGKAILVSGHDLKDLKELLEQTKNKDINIYTHGEMLPAHGYPELKKYPHLVGNYGGAWQEQKQEFENFSGSILMTTNCIIAPKESYKKRIFTKGLVGIDSVSHIENDDYSKLIDACLEEKGFEKDEEEKSIMVGFGHNTVISIADKVIEKVKDGKIKHIFLIGGCDGAKIGRNYYTDFAMQVPKNSLILTLACGKYRFNKFDFGSIDEIPRLLDVGQCNDAFSAIKIALALSKALNCSVNDLPLSLILSWFEQKAVSILLTLLYLGIQNIKIGPTKPAFLTDNIFKMLQEKYSLKPIGDPKKDLEDILK